jgi:hypothetical protein
MGSGRHCVKRTAPPRLKKARTCREGTGPGSGARDKLGRINKLWSGCGPQTQGARGEAGKSAFKACIRPYSGAGAGPRQARAVRAKPGRQALHQRRHCDHCSPDIFRPVGVRAGERGMDVDVVDVKSFVGLHGWFSETGCLFAPMR